MKKLKILLLLIVSAFYLSCEDAYKIEQDGEYQEDVTFLKLSDMESYLSTVYASTSVNSELVFTSLFTDEVGISTANAGQNIDLYKFFLNNNDGYASAIWITHYSAINNANRLLRGAARIVPSSDEVARYNSILAEARALRAFAHFQLLSYYSEDLKNDSSLGIMIVDRVPLISEDLQLPRSTTGEVYAFIEADLQFAEEFLGTGQSYYYFSKNALAALRAKMYAYRGNYPLAETYADQLIYSSGLTLTPAGFFVNNTTFYNPVTTTSPYKKMWSDNLQGEIIWGLSRLPGEGGPAGTWFTNNTSRSGSPFHDMGRNLFNLLADQNQDGVVSNPLTVTNPTDHDIRAKAFIDPSSTISPAPATVQNYINVDVLAIDKYPGKAGDAGALTNDLKVFRLSEMYLIKAEARIAAGDLQGAATLLKTIRDVRTYETRNSAGVVLQPAVPAPLPEYANATEAWADVLLERRKELAFEGHRYIDLKRLGDLAGGKSIDRYFRDCTENNAPICTLPLSDYRFRLPVPIDELIGNANIQQNPGY